MQTGAFKPLNTLLPFSTHPLSFQAPWICPLPAPGHSASYSLVTNLFLPLDCEPHESRAGAGWVIALPSTYHTQSRRSASVHEIQNKRGLEITVTETSLTKGLFLGTRLIEVIHMTRSH